MIKRVKSYKQITGKSPFEGITPEMAETPPQLPSDASGEALGGLPEVSPTGYQDYMTDIMKEFSDMGISSSVNIQEMFQEQLDTQRAEVEKTRAIREARIKEQFAPLITEAKERGEKAIGGIEAISARAGGLGASSIQEGMIRDQEKANNKMMADIKIRMSDAIAKDDQNEIAKVNIMYQQVIDMQDKIWQRKMQFQEAKLKMLEVASGMETREASITGYYKGTPTMTREQVEKEYGLNLEKLGLDEKQFNEQMSLNQEKFEESKKQFGENQAMDKIKIDLQKTQNTIASNLQFQTLLNNTPAGQKVDITLGDGTILSGMGRFRYASEIKGAGGENILEEDDGQYMGLLDQNPETGDYAVNPDKIEMYISQKGGDRLVAFNKANALADKLNAEKMKMNEIQKVKMDEEIKSYKEKGLGVWGTGAKTRVEAIGKIGTGIGEKLWGVDRLDRTIAGNIQDWLFGE